MLKVCLWVVFFKGVVSTPKVPAKGPPRRGGGDKVLAGIHSRWVGGVNAKSPDKGSPRGIKVLSKNTPPLIGTNKKIARRRSEKRGGGQTD